MISIETITIKEFRGIRSLTLDFKGKNFAVCGPNGTGKSGVVDALEFVLTGNISRLSGDAKGDVSTKVHGPHVDVRAKPEKSSVAAKVIIPSLSKTITIERNLKKPKEALVTPDSPEVRKVLKQIEEHPEIVLSRRELIRYVLATPGKRADEVQSLLHLDQIEQVRQNLLKIANGCKKQLAPFETAVTQTRGNLLRALGLTELKKDTILPAINAQRAILGLPELTDITEKTSFKEGMAVPAEAKGVVNPPTIPKVQAVADIKAAKEAIAELSGEPTTVKVKEVMPELTALNNDPSLVASIQRQAFYSMGLGLIENEFCPFCDTPWNHADLKKHVQEKIIHFNEIARRREAAESKIRPVCATVRKVQAAINSLLPYAKIARPPAEHGVLSTFSDSRGKDAAKMAAFLPLSETITVLADASNVPPGIITTIDELEKTVAALPDPSKQDAAKEWLTVAQERLESWREAKRNHKAAEEQEQKARKIYNRYVSASDKVLKGIYTAVEKDFAELYCFINKEDEEKFKAKLTPDTGKLDLVVDFYGRDYFPPGAYHSEGHQDSMGICLYLALMRHIQGEAFTFTVLDDVLMSVDAAHRREVCALLKSKFPNTQFIITTHDPIWLHHMRTEALVGQGSAIRFRSWSVEHGPTGYDARDVWMEINDFLKAEDVRSAAALLRNYLEFISAELCHRLRATVEYRGDAQYQLDDLLPAAIRQMKSHYKRARDVAKSWGQEDVIKLLSEREAEFAALVSASNVEQWQVNAAIHYNSWASLNKNDFNPVVESFQKLLVGFTCSACNGYLRASPDRRAYDSIRCDCGKIQINLKKK